MWNCCRTCLSSKDLNPIFYMQHHFEKYTDILLSTTGLKVEFNDCLPQLMCASCINLTNEFYKFRKKCEVTQKILQGRIENNIIEDNTEKIIRKKNQTAYIDITDLVEEDYSDLDELPLDASEETNLEDGTTGDKSSQVKQKRLTKERKVREKKIEEIECEHCHKKLTSKLSLRNHYKIHTGFDIVCEHCGRKFITRRLLLMHCRAKHGYEKTDKCSYCDYRASNAEQVKIHERLHTGERPYVCKECGAGFHRNSSYLQHVAIHLPEKTVQCDECPALFKSVTLMRIHKNRHRAPQYSYRCMLCDKTFARRRNVTRHVQRIHGIQTSSEYIDKSKLP